jgi:putative protease
MRSPKKQLPFMELLAPAGSFGAFEAALEEGADAIYIGAPDLNARALSRDFSYSEIKALVREAHKANVRVYIAMNSLVKEDEIETAVEGLAFFEEIKPDALIIQDLGLFKLARTYFPELSLHASTLMSVHNSLAVKKMTDLGFKRVVLPRELTLEEIKDIYNKTGAELEVFVHGAMCFSYSGLCMFSSMFGGKSSLRGRCVQPCRRRYSWQRKKGHVKKGKQSEKDGGYLFSMNDLSGIDVLHELRSAGVSCLKIEGRLKSAEYVRKTVRAYRLLLDDKGEHGPSRSKKKEARRYLDEAMGRRRSTGFFLSQKPHEAVTPHLSGNTGMVAGRVLKLEEISDRGHGHQVILMVDLIRDIRVGERLRLHDERSGERTAFTLRTLKIGNRIVKQAAGGRKVQVILQRKDLKSRKGTFKGSLFKVDVSSGRSGEQKAKTFFLNKQKKTLKPDERKIEHILNACLTSDTKTMGRHVQHGRGNRLPIWVRISSLRDRQYRLPVVPERYIVPLDQENIDLLNSAPAKLRRLDQEIIWSLPPIIQEDSLSWFQKTIKSLIKDSFEAFQLGHFSQVGFFDEYIAAGTELQLFGHYTCNVLNSVALKAFSEQHFSSVQFSMETDEDNLDLAIRHFRSSTTSSSGKTRNLAVGMYVYGRPPLFTARLDDSHYKYGKRFVSPKNELFALDRGDGVTSARSVLPFSLLDQTKELENCGVNYLVIDVSTGNIKRNISELIALSKRYGKELQIMPGNFKSGLL